MPSWNLCWQLTSTINNYSFMSFWRSLEVFSVAFLLKLATKKEKVCQRWPPFLPPSSCPLSSTPKVDLSCLTTLSVTLLFCLIVSFSLHPFFSRTLTHTLSSTVSCYLLCGALIMDHPLIFSCANSTRAKWRKRASGRSSWPYGYYVPRIVLGQINILWCSGRTQAFWPPCGWVESFFIFRKFSLLSVLQSEFSVTRTLPNTYVHKYSHMNAQEFPQVAVEDEEEREALLLEQKSHNGAGM